eukprot:gene28104-34029_t
MFSAFYRSIKRQSIGLLHNLARHIGFDILDAVDPRQMRGLKVPVVVKISHDNPQQRVALPQHDVAFHHLGQPLHRIHEMIDRFGILCRQPHPREQR